MDRQTDARQSDPYVPLCFAGDTKTDRQTDVGQSDPYVPLCFAGDTKTNFSCCVSSARANEIMRRQKMEEERKTRLANLENVAKKKKKKSGKKKGASLRRSKSIC